MAILLNPDKVCCFRVPENCCFVTHAMAYCFSLILIYKYVLHNYEIYSLDKYDDNYEVNVSVIHLGVIEIKSLLYNSKPRRIVHSSLVWLNTHLSVFILRSKTVDNSDFTITKFPQNNNNIFLHFLFQN